MVFPLTFGCRDYILRCWFKAVDKYHYVIYTAVIDVHILWIRFCTWIGMTTMEESRHRLILFRSYFCCIIWDCWSLQFYIPSLFVRIQLFIYCFSYFNLQLWKRFRGNDKPPAHLGSSRDYNVDMIPKVCFHFLSLL